MDSLAGLDLSKIPAAPPPPGVQPDFTNPPSRGHFPRIIIYVTLPPMVLFLGLRVYTRLKMAKTGLDDVLCILGATSSIAQAGFTLRVLEQAAGPHMWNVPLSSITASYGQNNAAILLTYYFAAMFIKASILATYLRIFHPSRGARIIIWTGIVLSTLCHLASIAIYLATCLPRPEDEASGGWTSPQFAARTLKIVGYRAVVFSTVGTIIDFYILFTPLIFLWKLKMPVSRKLGLSGIFATGAIACVSSILSTIFRWELSHSTEQAQDSTWKSPRIFAFSIAEINIGIVCGCIPVVFTVFKGFASWSSSWFTRLRYLTPMRTRGTEQAGPSDASDISVEKASLPPIPNSGLKGLRSIVRNFNRTNPATTRAHNSEMQTIQSAEYDYHVQMNHYAS